MKEVVRYVSDDGKCEFRTQEECLEYDAKSIIVNSVKHKLELFRGYELNEKIMMHELPEFIAENIDLIRECITE